jgi:heptosyltransferase-3
MTSVVEPPQRILVINVSRIGDTLLVTPALRALAAAWPQAHITFLGHPKRVEIMQQLPFIAELGAITKLRAPWRGRLPDARWDLALVLGFDRALVEYALRVADRVVAFRQGDDALNARLFRLAERPAFQTLHAARHPLLLTQALGVPDAGLRLAYRVTAEEMARARATLPQGAKPLVGFQVASFPTKGYRDWPLEHFAALGERILAHWPGARLIFLGGALERPRIVEFAQRFAARMSVYAGTLTLRQSAALMSQLDLYVGVDTGPTHIMGALDPPMVALYHCYSPSRVLAPLERPRCYVVDHPRAVEGCPPETSMAEISVDAVWARVCEALGA